MLGESSFVKTVIARLFVLFQYTLPQHLLSRLCGSAAVCRCSWFKNLLIDSFVKIFAVDLSEAAVSKNHGYEHFNAFFTRALRKDARPIDQGTDSLISPADGTISQLGAIRASALLQAKDRRFTLDALMADSFDAALFKDGQFATIYLSPRDYHRVHMPCPGRLEKMRYVPGRLYSVNTTTTNNVKNLFARNERLVCLFESAQGPFAMVLVGAMIVAAIETSWAGPVVPAGRNILDWHYGRVQTVDLNRGDEMARFQLGSTVILILPQGRGQWNEDLKAGDPVRMGQHIGRLCA